MRTVLFAALVCACASQASGAIVSLSFGGGGGEPNPPSLAPFTLTEETRISVAWSGQLAADWNVYDGGPFIDPEWRYMIQSGQASFSILITGDAKLGVFGESIGPEEYFSGDPTAPPDLGFAGSGIAHFVLPAGNYSLWLSGSSTKIPAASFWSASAEVNAVPIPEPATLGSLALGLVALAILFTAGRRGG